MKNYEKKKRHTVGFIDFKLFLTMKLILILICGIGLLNVSADNSYAQATKLSVNFSNSSVKDVLSYIEDHSEFSFMYDNNEIDVNQKVNVDAKDQTIDQILGDIFNNDELSYRIIDKHIVIFPTEDNSAKNSFLSQQNVVSGKVIDSDGKALPGVTVILKGTTQGDVTDQNGEYSIPNVPDDAVLQFSFIGMQAQEIPVAGKAVVNVTMQQTSIGLEEVVAIGYGVQRKSDITGAVASVSSEDITKLATSTPAQALQGKAAGVSVLMNSGSPGASASIKIRGVGTTNNTDPLYVVDGLPMNDIDYLNSNNIESIEILKDASATAIYGSRGANGVILVTTKKGSEGTLNVNFNAYYGIETLLNPPTMLTSTQYAALTNEAYTNANLDPPYANTTNLSFYTNWYDVVSRIGTVQNYNISFSGGSKRISSFLSGNYYSNEGIIRSTKYEKMSFIQNTTIKATDFLTFETSMSGSFSNKKGLDETGIFLSALIAPPDIPIFDPYSKYYSGIQKLRLANPAGRIARNNGINGSTDLVGNVTANLTLLDGLKFKSVFGMRYTEGRGSNFSPVYYETANISNTINTVSRSASKATDWTWDNILTYNKKFNDHEITAMGAISAREYNSDQFSASKQNVTIEDKEFWYFDAATENPLNSGSGASLSMLSYLGRLNYSYKNRYLFTGSFRADGSSRFLPKNRWGYFPSGALAWKISEEDFFKNISQRVISSAKIRVGYGEIGNERINSYYPYLTPMRQQRYYTLGVNQVRINGAGASALGNPEVQWETSAQSNLGLDLTLLDGRLSTTMDYYIRKTDNILLNQSVPNTSGFGSITRNVGGMENRGFEFTATYKESRRDFSYDVSANISTVKNKVTNLGTTEALISSFAYTQVLIDFQGAFGSIIRSEVGKPYGQFYGWMTDGIFQTPDEINQYTFEGQKIQPNAVPGDFKFKDLNGDGVINDDDKDFIGNPIPDVTFGLTFNAKYKKFDMSLSLQGQAGNQIYNATKYYFMRFDGIQNVRAEFLDKYWTGPNSTNSQPAVTANEGRNDANFRNSDYYIENGSYLRLQNLQIGYNFTPKITNGFNPDCRLYLSAQNLLTITGYSGFEPEISGNGVDRGVYPQATTFMIGTIINF